jgi:NADPH-dependent ferric siderophore reductase
MAERTNTGGRAAGRFSSLQELFLLEGTIADVEQVAARWRRIRIASPRLAGLTGLPGQYVQILVTPALQALRGGMRDLSRAYTLFDVDPAAGWADVLVLDHEGDGPGARWGRKARIGQRVLFTRPDGGLAADAATPLLLAGDETSLPGFAAITRHLPADKPLTALVEVGSLHDALPLPDHVRTSWLPRASGAADDPEKPGTLLAALSRLDLPAQGRSAYLTGEARTIQALRSYLVRERGWSRRDITTKPYWTPGKRGLD